MVEGLIRNYRDSQSSALLALHLTAEHKTELQLRYKTRI
jgi:hypothetical protein